MLNGRPYPLKLVLDQGYWDKTGMTPPDDAALRMDVVLAKAMGFNGVRKHQKIEVPRYLYWADRLGLLVWEEMPSAYRFSKRSVARLTIEWLEVLRRDASHPCIMAWVPFNESWGVPNLPNSPTERELRAGVVLLDEDSGSHPPRSWAMTAGKAWPRTSSAFTTTMIDPSASGSVTWRTPCCRIC